jgi:hypothetical protein
VRPITNPDAGGLRNLPQTIVDGPEFVGRTLDAWAASI